jgi:GGDEF domain-containing protein
VLKEFALRLAHNCRPGERPFRVGGEEFAVLLANTAIEAGLQRAEALRQAVESLRSTALEVDRQLWCGHGQRSGDAGQRAQARRSGLVPRQRWRAQSRGGGSPATLNPARTAAATSSPPSRARRRCKRARRATVSRRSSPGGIASTPLWMPEKLNRHSRTLNPR